MSGPGQGDPHWGQQPQGWDQQGWGQQPPQQGWGQQPPQQGWGQPQQPYPAQPQQPYPGQPYQPYPGQQGPPLPPPPRRRTGLFVGLGAVVVAGAVVLALVLTGVIGGGDGGSSSPKQVAQNFLAAAKRGDAAAQRSYVCAQKLSSFKPSDSSVVAGATITSVDTSDSSHATATVRLVVAGRTVDVPLELVKEGGDWKVCGTGSAMDVGGSSAPSATSAPLTPTPATPSPTAPAADSAAIFGRLQQIYAGLTQASLESARDKSPLPYGLYVIKYNYPGLHYTAQECGVTGDAVSDPTAFVPVQGTLALDPTYTKIADGRYAGTPIAGTVYSFTLNIKGAKSGASTAKVHATLLDNVLYFFFVCE